MCHNTLLRTHTNANIAGIQQTAIGDTGTIAGILQNNYWGYTLQQLQLVYYKQLLGIYTTATIAGILQTTINYIPK